MVQVLCINLQTRSSVTTYPGAFQLFTYLVNVKAPLIKAPLKSQTPVRGFQMSVEGAELCSKYTEKEALQVWVCGDSDGSPRTEKHRIIQFRTAVLL